jgi:CheY-like chemotaxis protein
MNIPPHSPAVLVLDPIDDERDMYAEYLRATGFEVRTHPHADGVLAAISAAPPDVVIVRLLPTPPGVGTTEIVRHLKQRTSTPVVVITSSPLDSDRQAAAEARCDAYLVLPVIPDALVSAIKRVLQIA